MKGLTTPLSRWLQGSYLFVQVQGDLRVTSYWIDTLVLKNWGKYLRYFAASPFPLQGKTNACSRGSKKDFWRHCRGVYAHVKTYQVPITNSYPSHYIICHLPLVFLSPTSTLPFLRLLPYVFLFVFPRAFYLLASFLAKNLLIWIHSRFSTWIIFDPYVLVLKPQLV